MAPDINFLWEITNSNFLPYLCGNLFSWSFSGLQSTMVHRPFPLNLSKHKGWEISRYNHLISLSTQINTCDTFSLLRWQSSIYHFRLSLSARRRTPAELIQDVYVSNVFICYALKLLYLTERLSTFPFRNSPSSFSCSYLELLSNCICMYINLVVSKTSYHFLLNV